MLGENLMEGAWFWKAPIVGHDAMIRNELTAQVMIKKGEIVLVLHNSEHKKRMLLVFLTCTEL